MQIVQALGGYTLGRADLVRRAMSKKKADVMAAERQNFVYGNAAENVPGCIAKGISEEVGNQVYDSLITFAGYGFNKSHAAAYAVVAYETAWLKYYYRTEFMAALMTSVIEKPEKVAEYIYSCRQLKVEILPPDINQGRGAFSVQDNKIRYALNAIKGIGQNVVDEIVREREENGPYRSVQDFMERLSTKEVNKKTIENFIKAGAFDCFPQTRKQQMAHYPVLLEQVERHRKDSVSGQFSLFDTGLLEESEKVSMEAPYPKVGEYDVSQRLAFEKEVLGFYVSGHPLEEDADLLKKNVTARTADFIVDEESGEAPVADGARVTVGGMVTGKTVKITKNGQQMAFVTIEDMIGSLEVLVFPKDYEKYRSFLQDDARVLITGRASVGDEPVGKLILERIIPFEQVPKEIWLRFESKADYDSRFEAVFRGLSDYDGHDGVVIYLKDTKQYKRLPSSYDINASAGALEIAKAALGEENVVIVCKKA